MCLSSIPAAGRILLRMVSSSAVRIALGATLTTPQPIAPLYGVTDVPMAAQFMPAVPPAAADGIPTDARPGWASGFIDVEPEPGWG